MFRTLDPARQAMLRELMLRLVTPGEGGEPVRTRVPRRSVTGDEEHLELVEQLVAARLLASDGRDGRRAHRKRFPVFDLDLVEVGELDAPYPTNLPWPTLLRDGDGWLLVTFNGAGHGGDLVGYGTHGTVVLMRAPAASP